MKHNTHQAEYDITFICRKERQYFAEPVLEKLRENYNVQILLLEHKRQLSVRKIKGKIVWVEWATKFAQAVSKRKLKNRKIVVRLHRYELETDFMNTIRWKNIDLVIFVNKQFEREFKQKIDNQVHTVTIPNALSVQDFPYFPPAAREPGEDTRLIYYSVSFDPLKGYLELLRFFKKLLDRERSFKLTLMARSPQSEEEKSYLEQLRAEAKKLKIEDKVDFLVRNLPLNLKEDRKNVSDILKQHDIFIGFSKIESFHYAFAESLLSGLQCFYNAWKNFYLEDVWTNWACFSEEEMVNGIIQWSRLSLSERSAITEKNRNDTIRRFGSETVSEIYRQVFSNLI